MKKFSLLFLTGIIMTQVVFSQTVNDGFIRLSGGKFTMGSPNSERQRQADEIQHEVRLDPFYVDPYEVTQEDYEKLINQNPSTNKGKKLPVENVTWFDAIKYCNAKSVSANLTPVYTISADNSTVTWNTQANGYRLLTEAEWEYACRSGTSTVFNFGDRIQSNNANFEGTYPYGIEDNYDKTRDKTVKQSKNRGRTIECGSLPANAFGLYDMHGNVSEWVFDWYGSYSTENNIENPTGSASGTYRVNRGGAWNDFGKHLRSSYRSAINPLDADENTGFRICRGSFSKISNTTNNDTITTTQIGKLSLPKNPRILIAYFSYTGNDRKAAQLIQKKLNCDIVEIVRKEKYSGPLYDTTGLEVIAGTHPELSSKIPDLSKYDVVILGYPTWWASMPAPVWTFVEKCKFNGKIILPFSSNGGTQWGDSISDLSKTAIGAYVLPGYQFYYSGGNRLETELMEWLNTYGVN